MSIFVDLAFRSSVVMAVGGGVLWMFRRQPAAFRHWTLAVVIGLAAAQPLLRLALPSWALPVAPGAMELPAPAPAGADVATSVAFDVVTPVGTRPRDTRLDQIAFRVWGLGAAAGLSVLLLGLAWLRWQTGRSTGAGERWARLADSVATEIGARRGVRVLEAGHPTLLVTWGARRPVILLPKGASAWPDDRARLVLAHEMAHVTRQDWLVQLAAECARALFWFNPLFWLACSRLRSESEQACDDRVLDLGAGNTSYASHLVELARSFSGQGRTWLPAPSMARPSTLERRIAAMLNPHLNRRPVSRGRKLLTAAWLLAAALPVAALSMNAGAPSGTLRDPHGRVLPGATVRLSAIGAEAIHETQSDSTGSFQFGEIADGEYMLSARLPGFMSARQRVRVAAGMPPLDITLPVGTLKETITVRRGVGEPDSSPRPVTAARPQPAAPKCGSTEVGGNIKPPMKLKDVRPRYSQALADANVEGEVLLQAIIGVNGRVRNVEVVSAVHADLEESAINAVSQWEFSPTWLNCEAIEVRMFVTVAFKLDR